MSWSGRRVLVTGAAGFIGSHLAEHLVELGATTRVLVRYNSRGTSGWLDGSRHRSSIEVMRGDVADPDSVAHAMEGIEVAFHLAALIGIPYSYEAARSYVRTNVEGTLNVLECARRYATPLVVHTSTSEVYGTARSIPMAEDHPLHAQSPYAATKIAADQLAEAYACSFALPVVTVRPFNTYGPRQSERAVIPTIIGQLLAGLPLRLGNLTPTRDFTYVDDTVKGFVAAAVPEAAGRTINLGTGTMISIGEIARKLGVMLGRGDAIAQDESRARPGSSEVERLCSDNRLARDLLGWAPTTTLDDGLAHTVRWLQEQVDQGRAHEYVV